MPPLVFQAFANYVLQDMLGKFVTAYIDKSWYIPILENHTQPEMSRDEVHYGTLSNPSYPKLDI